MKPGTIHAAKLDKSLRLQRVVLALKLNPKGLTTRGLQLKANICNAHTCAAELRAQGYPVTVTPDGRRNGATVYRYTLAAS